MSGNADAKIRCNILEYYNMSSAMHEILSNGVIQQLQRVLSSGVSRGLSQGGKNKYRNIKWASDITFILPGEGGSHPCQGRH